MSCGVGKECTYIALLYSVTRTSSTSCGTRGWSPVSFS